MSRAPSSSDAWCTRDTHQAQSQSQSQQRRPATALTMRPLLVALVAALVSLIASVSSGPLPLALGVGAHNVPVSLVEDHGPVASQLMEAALVAYASGAQRACTRRGAMAARAPTPPIAARAFVCCHALNHSLDCVFVCFCYL